MHFCIQHKNYLKMYVLNDLSAFKIYSVAFTGDKMKIIQLFLCRWLKYVVDSFNLTSIFFLNFYAWMQAFNAKNFGGAYGSLSRIFFTLTATLISVSRNMITLMLRPMLISVSGKSGKLLAFAKRVNAFALSAYKPYLRDNSGPIQNGTK